MKRVLAASGVVAASLGIVLGIAGTAAGVEYEKFPTKAECVSVGNAYVQSDQARNFECSGPHAGKASEKWWLYLVP